MIANRAKAKKEAKQEGRDPNFMQTKFKRELDANSMRLTEEEKEDLPKNSRGSPFAF